MTPQDVRIQIESLAKQAGAKAKQVQGLMNQILALTPEITTFIERKLSVLSVSPSSVPAALLPGQTKQFAASGVYNDGTTSSNMAVTWSATGGTITTGGLFTAGAVAGPFKVTAASGGLTTSVSGQVELPAPTLVSLTVSPGTAALLLNAQQTFTAAAMWSDGSTKVPTITWSATGGMIGANGLYVASSVGNYQVKALNGTVSGVASVVVTAPVVVPPTLTSLDIVPASATLVAGATQTFTPTARWSDGSTTLPPIVWTCSGGTVSAAGVYTAPAGAGSYTVTATSGTMYDGSLVTVGAVIPPPVGSKLFEDTYVGGVMASYQNGVGYAGYNGSDEDWIKVVPDSGNASGYALGFFYNDDLDGEDAWLEERMKFPDLTEGYIEMTVATDPNYRHRDSSGPDNNKLLRLWDLEYGNSFVHFGMSTLPRADTLGSQIIVEFSAAGGTGNYGTGPWTTIFRPGTVDVIGFYFKLASGMDVKDGIIKVWVNKTLVYNHVDLALYTPTGAVGGGNWIRNGYLFGWSNSGFTEDTLQKLRKLYVSRTPPT